MTTYDWPATRAFVPARSELRVIDNLQRFSESPLSGAAQVLAMPGARWGWADDFAPQARADRDAVEGFILRMRGRQNRMRRWDIKRPQPRGTIALSGVTVGATAAQFSGSLVLVGCRGANAVLGGSFEVDTNADGLSDGWSRFSTGSTGTLNVALGSFGATDGGQAQWVTASALAAGDGNRQGVQQTDVPVSRLAGKAVTVAASVLGTSGIQIAVYVAWYDGGGSPVGSPISASVTGTAAAQTIAASGTCPSSAVAAAVQVYQYNGAGGVASLHIDSVRLVEGGASASYPSPAQLCSGDWLGLPSQLVRVVADAQANDAGVMTVQVEHMLRQSVVSGSAVVLDRPTTTYRRTDAGLIVPRTAGNVDEGFSAEWVEDWTA